MVVRGDGAELLVVAFAEEHLSALCSARLAVQLCVSGTRLSVRGRHGAR